MSAQRLHVLFLCTGNAARSQMAEALLRHLSKGRAEVFSAGSVPAADIHPQVRAVLQEKFGIDTSGHVSQIDDQPVAGTIRFRHYRLRQSAGGCPVFPGDPERINWSFEDPLQQPTPEAQHRACEQVANSLAGRLRIWMSLPEVRRRLEAGT